MKHTLKTIELLEQHIDLLAENGIYEIERDLLLERLRGLYASVVALEAKAEEERVLDALMGLGVAGEVSTEEPEIEVERIYAEPEEEVESEEIAAPEEPEEEVVSEEIAAPEEPEEEVVFEEVAEPVAEEETEQEPEPMAEEEPAEEAPAAYVEVESAINRYIGAIEEPAIEEPATEPEEEVATEVEPAPEEEVVEEPLDVVEEKSGPEQIDHRAALSLYDDDDDDEVVELAPAEEAEQEAEQEAEPVVEEEPAASDEQVTLAELLAAEGAVDVATAASSTLSLHQSIGLNDKYILMRDLFAGDADYYESAISTLDEFDNLDDAMLYIHDNFRWSPNSEGARLLMELLACKLF